MTLPDIRLVMLPDAIKERIATSPETLPKIAVWTAEGNEAPIKRMFPTGVSASRFVSMCSDAPSSLWDLSMLRSLRHHFLTGENRRNTFSGLVILFTMAFFYWNTDPDPCGAAPVATRRHVPRPLPIVQAQPVPTIQQVEERALGSTSPGADAQPAEAAPPAEVKLPENGGSLEGETAIKASMKLLAAGQENLKKATDYTVQFRRQERIGGALLDPQSINLKIRHEPFSIYMKWTEGDKGRQLIYVTGQHDDHVLVQLGGITGRLAGTVALKPDDSRILAESRYPATCAGLLELTKKIIEHHDADLKRGSGFHCEIKDGDSFDSRPCYLTTFIYDSPEVNPDYHKSMIQIDKELSVPLCVRNYTWVEGKPAPTDGEHNLIEHYAFTGLELNNELADEDFQKQKYKMR